MTGWILIFVVLNSQPSQSVSTFATESACEAAGHRTKAALYEQLWLTRVAWTCNPVSDLYGEKPTVPRPK